MGGILDSFAIGFDDEDERFDVFAERVARIVHKEDPKLAECLLKFDKKNKVPSENISFQTPEVYKQVLTLASNKGAVFGMELNTANALIAAFIIPLFMQKIRTKLQKIKEEEE